MKVHRLKKFNVIFDGNMSIAVDMVKIIDVSATKEDHVRLFEKHSEIFESLYESLTNLSQKYNEINIVSNNLLSIYHEIVNRFNNNHKFVPQYFLSILEIPTCLILNIEDNRDDLFYEITRKHYGFAAIDIMKEKFDPIKELNRLNVKDRIVPFCSKKGTYGINTYLYMHLNNVIPIGISTDPFNVHGGEYADNRCKIIIHDYAHESGVFNNSILFRQRNKNFLDNIYEKIFSVDISEDRRKMYLFILFLQIHEIYNYDPKLTLGKYKFFTKSIIEPQFVTDAFYVISKLPEFDDIARHLAYYANINVLDDEESVEYYKNNSINNFQELENLFYKLFSEYEKDIVSENS